MPTMNATTFQTASSPLASLRAALASLIGYPPVLARLLTRRLSG